MADEPRLLADAAGAFIDRTPIDWSALLSRVRTSPDRALFENLHALSTVRARASAAPGAVESAPASAAAWILVALCSVETVVLLALVAVALTRGEAIGERTPQLILALAFAASSLPLGAATCRDPRSLFLLATFTAAASIFARSTVFGLTAPWSGPVDRLLHGVWIDAFVPACMWQFALGFPRLPRFTRFDRFARPAVAASWVLSTVLFALNIAVARLRIQTGPFAYVSPDHASHLFWRLFSLSVAGALIAIVIRARRAPFSERRKVTRLALAIGGGLGPFLILGVVRTAVPAVDDWFGAFGSWGAVWLYRLIAAALAITPVLCTAAVFVDRPFELQVVLRRRRGWLGAIASRVSRAAAHYDGRVARALERLSRSRGTREAIAGLSREIGDLLGAQSVAILLPEQSGSLVNWSNAAVLLRSDSGLAALVCEAEEALDVSSASPLFALLPRADRDWLAANAVHLIGPLKRRDGEIAAVVAIGPKSNGAPFDRRDRWLTVALLAAAVAAFDADCRSRESSPPGRLPAPDAPLAEAAFECPLCGIVSASSPLPCDCGRVAAIAALPHCVAEKFRVARRIGSGGMGVVYLAHDAVLDRDVALKTLPSLRPRAVEQLRDEARAMAALNHESLATLYGVEIWRQTPVLVVEYFPNGTLARRLSRGPLSPEDTVALGVRLARALAYMHTRAMLHRDLKPSNIAFTASGAGKLLDFGLATLSSSARVDNEPSDASDATGGPFVGTRAYASPEALRGEPALPAHDRWALAIVLLEAASGVNPFAIGHRRAARGEARGGVSDVSDVCDVCDVCCAESLRAVPELRAFLERALAPSPDHRFNTSDAFLAALEDVADRLALRVR